MVDDFLRAKADAPMLKSFVNTRLAETWEEDYASKVSADGLMAKRLAYESGTCPDGVVLLTAGVDVQDNRLAVSVWGWGDRQVGWLVWHQELMGDPTQAEVWGQLDQVLATGWPTECGKELKITQMCVDSGGHCTHETYCVCARPCAAGRGGDQGQQQARQCGGGQGQQGGCELARARDQAWRDALSCSAPTRSRPRCSGGCGMTMRLRFGMAADDEYFKQLTSEKQALRYVKGFPVREWVKKSSERNEALDCCGLCLCGDVDI
jgi:phage terminase large subunit GpA-like protein